MADALVCMTHLLLALRQLKLTSARSARLEALMLVTMAGHDFMHPGGRNAHPGQLENLSVQALAPLLQASGVTVAEQSQMRACILATDPERVPAQHRAAAGRRFDLADRAYAQVEKLSGRHATLLNNRGYSYMLRGDLSKARADLSAAIFCVAKAATSATSNRSEARLASSAAIASLRLAAASACFLRAVARVLGRNKRERPRNRLLEYLESNECLLLKAL